MDASERFATKCAEASVGYAHASFFAGLNAFNIAVENWAKACEDLVGTPPNKPKSWFRHPDSIDGRPASTEPAAAVFEFWQPLAALPQAGTVPWMFSLPMFTTAWVQMMQSTPVAAWMQSPAMVPHTATASVWPMTWSMMAMGMPLNVAKPTAEANAAAYEAYESAKQVANDQMAAFNETVSPSRKRQEASSTRPFADPDDPFALFRPWFAEPSPLPKSA